MSIFFKILIAFCALASTATSFADEPADSVADAFGFPREKLLSKDLLAVARLENSEIDPKLKAHYLIKAPDDTFAIVRVFVTEKGALFTPKFEKRLKTALLESAKLPPEERPIVLIDVPNVGKVISFVASMGPGGATTRAVIQLDAQGIEVAVDQSQNFTEPLVVAPETKKYHDSLQNNHDFSTKALGKALETISRDIVAGKYSFAKAVAAPVTLPPAEPPPSPPPIQTPQAQEVATPTVAQKAEPETAPPQAPQKFPWLWLLVILAIAAALWRMRKSE